MKKIRYLLTILCTGIVLSCAQREKKMDMIEKDTPDHIEKFDFAYAEKVKKETRGWNNVERDGWYIKLYPDGWPQVQEYAP